MGSGFMHISPPPKLGALGSPSRTCALSTIAVHFGRPLTLPVVELLVAPSERKVQPAAPEEATLTLKKFADIPWVSFGDVPPGTSAVSSLHIVNPSKAEVHLTLERFPADKGAVHHVAARISLRSRRAQLIGGENVLCVP